VGQNLENPMTLMIRSRDLLRLMAAAGAVAVLAGCASAPRPQPVVATIAAQSDLGTLTQLIRKAGLDAALDAAPSVTVFAPSDAAFAAVPKAQLDKLAADPAELARVLGFHVVPGAALTAAEVKPGNVKTQIGANLPLAKAGDIVTVDEAMVTHADVRATNGVIHVVDRVLMPPKR
jgi:uncharacterized surface protein with fasciclin (FAS1) repeats